MENQSNNSFNLDSSSENIVIDNQLKQQIMKLCTWTELIGLLGMITIGLMALLIIGGGSTLLTTMAGNGLAATGGFTMIIFIYLPFFAFGFYIMWLLYKFAKSTRQGLRNNEQHLINEGFAKLATHYKIYGIAMIISLIIFIIGALFMVLAMESLGTLEH